MLRLRLSYIVNFILKQKAPLLGAFCILAFFKHLCCGQEFRNSELGGEASEASCDQFHPYDLCHPRPARAMHF